MSEWQDISTAPLDRESWSKAVEAAKADPRYPRGRLLHLIASGPDDRTDVHAARRLLEKGRYEDPPQ